MTWNSTAFPATGVGVTSAAPLIVTLWNTGSSPVPIAGIGSSNANEFPFTTTCQTGASLPAASQCTVTVRFKPAAVGDRTATEIVGDGDVLQALAPRADDLLERESRWHALVPTRLALLDDAFAERVKPWPQISRELLARACMRSADLDVQRAITSQPRLEVRLTLLLWHLAGRWGRVEHGGIRLALPLTHRLLGRLVGAERPSVSHALGRLSQAGLVTTRDGALHLHGTAAEHLAALAHRPGARRDNETDAAVGA